MNFVVVPEEFCRGKREAEFSRTFPEGSGKSGEEQVTGCSVEVLGQMIDLGGERKI